MVRADPLIAIRLLLATLNASTTGPVADPLRISIEPLPRRMLSEKVTTTLLPTATLIAPSVGEKLVIVGAVVSAGGTVAKS